ncbi:MAG: type-F conjugative transfer system pilin assembly protein TrbC [Leptothrix sp. (in: Bacteria)]|nr:type-F conjugative transfer system pilin assembly protein TrbC [Leptothrix sp. (in: b-proteobacteria)]
MRLLAAAVLLPCIALAQPAPSLQSPHWPGPDDMARALKAQPLPAPERLTTQPLRETPRIAPDAAITRAAGTIDIAAMARQGAALTTPPPAATGTSALRIFITLDMPRGSLQRLVDQAARSGATLVLRGLKAQSMRQTLAAVSELVETRRVSWVIDPDAFTRYQVSAAPTFVLTLADEPVPGTPGFGSVPDLPRCAGTGCAASTPEAAYLSVSGDVSLDYALDAMLRRSPEAAPRASAILQRLRKS